MVGQFPILFLLTGSDPASQFQPVRMLQCEAKGPVFLLGPCDCRCSYLRVTSSRASSTTECSLKDMAVGAHMYLLIGHMLSHLGFEFILFFSHRTLKYIYEL